MTRSGRAARAGLPVGTRFGVGRAAALSVGLAAGLALAAEARAEPVVYGLDPTHTFVHFEWPHLGTSITRGRFNRKDGRVTLDRAAGRGRAEITIDLTSVSTGAAALDAALRGPEALDAEKHPQARFVGERFVFDGERVRAVEGTLTLRGRDAPLTLLAERFDCYLSPLFKREVCGGDFEATLRTAAWGFATGPAWPTEIRLRIQVEGIRQ